MTWRPCLLSLLLLTLGLPSLVSAQQGDFEINRKIKLSGRIAFSAELNGKEEIFVLDLDAQKVRTLVEGPGNNSYPDWSPDGKLVAFSSDRDGNREIYIADWEGGKLKRITQNKVNDDNPSWFPSGKELVYYSDLSSDPRADSVLVRSNVETGMQRRILALPGRNTTPKVSPAGSSVAYSTSRNWPGWDVCIWDFASDSDKCPLKGQQSFCRAVWSPAGKELVYVEGGSEQADLAILDLSSEKRRSLTTLEGRENDPAYSPDGKYLVFSADPEQDERFALYVMDLAKPEPRILLSSTHSLRYPSWSAVSTLLLEAERSRLLEQQAEAQRKIATPTPLNSPTPPTQRFDEGHAY